MATVARTQQGVAMITVLVVDDHPAVRSGLVALLSDMPGVEVVAEAGDAFAAIPALKRCRPDVVFLDHRLPGESGVSLCRRIKRETLAPAVAIFSAFARDQLAVPALVAGADALLDKGASVQELMATIHGLAAGERMLPEMGSRERLVVQTLPAGPQRDLVERMCDGASAGAAAAELGLSPAELSEHLEALLGRLLPEGDRLAAAADG